MGDSPCCVCELLISKEKKGPAWSRAVHGGGGAGILVDTDLIPPLLALGY